MMITLFKPGMDGSIRYCSIHDRQPLLTARYALTIAWRTGNGHEREKIYGFDSLTGLDRKLKQVFTRRIREGYSLLYTFRRNRPEDALLAFREIAGA